MFLRGSFFERSRSSGSKVKFLYLRSPWADFDETWWVYGSRQGNRKCGFKSVKGQGHRGQRSNFCISVVLGPISMKLGGFMVVDKGIENVGSNRSKVKVIGVKGQISVSP